MNEHHYHPIGVLYSGRSSFVTAAARLCDASMGVANQAFFLNNDFHRLHARNYPR